MIDLGWTRERLAAAAPAVVEAARWRIWAEAVWPVDDVAQAFAPEPPKDPGAAEAVRMGAKSKAQRHFNELRKLLYPADEALD